MIASSSTEASSCADNALLEGTEVIARGRLRTRSDTVSPLPYRLCYGEALTKLMIRASCDTQRLNVNIIRDQD